MIKIKSEEWTKLILVLSSLYSSRTFLSFKFSVVIDANVKYIKIF